ncbi:MAG: hypothetical protein F7O42_11970 [Opitutae bacterium]|nr:hypothetical protein [Opitutae bacterium]
MFIPLGGMHGPAKGTEKGVFSRLYEAKKIGEVHDSGHIGVGKFDAPFTFEVKLLRYFHPCLPILHR